MMSFNDFVKKFDLKNKAKQNKYKNSKSTDFY